MTRDLLLASFFLSSLVASGVSGAQTVRVQQADAELARLRPVLTADDRAAIDKATQDAGGSHPDVRGTRAAHYVEFQTTITPKEGKDGEPPQPQLVVSRAVFDERDNLLGYIQR